MLWKYLAYLALGVLVAASKSQYTIERDINRQPLTNNKVVLEVFFESHCGGCHTFITTQLKPLLEIKDILNYVDFQLVPAGHGSAQKVGNKYHFKCQHGESECQGNILMTCALNKLQKKKALDFIVCLQQSSKSWNKDGATCASKVGADWKTLKSCTNSIEGRDWQFINGLRTKNVNPEYVPSFYLNGVSSQLITKQLFKDALDVICSAADANKPAFPACQKYWMDDGK